MAKSLPIPLMATPLAFSGSNGTAKTLFCACLQYRQLRRLYICTLVYQYILSSCLICSSLFFDWTIQLLVVLQLSDMHSTQGMIKCHTMEKNSQQLLYVPPERNQSEFLILNLCVILQTSYIRSNSNYNKLF